MSTNLAPLESDDPTVAGFVVSFDTGVAKAVVWRSDKVISPALDAAKQYTANVLEQLMSEGREAEIRDTNWVSVTAAARKLIRDFNGKIHMLESVGDGPAN